MRSNLPLTPRPKILYCVSQHSPLVDIKLWMAMYGEKPPVNTKWKEFKAQHMTLGTRERTEFESYLKGKNDQETLNTLSALPLLRRAATMPASKAVDLYDATRRLLPGYPKELAAGEIGPVRGFDEIFSRYSPKQVMQVYRDLLRQGIGHARLDVGIEDTQPVILIRCDNMKEAAFVWAAFGGLEVCPACGKLFAPNPERENQKYCSALCAQRIYQREFRRRQKSKKSKRR